MKVRGEVIEISLEAKWRRLALGALALVSAAALGWAGARHAVAHSLAQSGDAAVLSRALALDPDHAELHREMGRQALFAFELAQAERSLQAALRHQPHDPQSWLEFAFVCEAQGDLGAARGAILKALELAPASALVLRGAGDFFARQGEWERAWPCFRRAMASDFRVVAPLLEACWKWAPDPDRILTDALPDRSYAYEAYLQFLMNRGEWERAARVWQRSRERGCPASTETALAYVNALVAAQRPAEARNVWQAWVPPSPDSGNLIHNAGFRQRILNGGFDWTHSVLPGVELAYDGNQDGGVALALRFSGQHNPDYWHLRQVVAVRPSTGYRLEASFKTERITSTSGPRLEVCDGYSGRVLAFSEAATGSTAWQRKVVEFQTPEETELVTVGVRRPAAPSWDEPIGGTLWVRDFSLRPAEQPLRPFPVAEARPRP